VGETLLKPDAHWAIWAVLLVTAAFALWAERTRWGSRLSGAVIAIGTTFVLSNLRVIPPAAPAYDTVWGYVVPLAIPLLLLKADLRRIVREAGPTLVAFLAGAVGTVIGTLVAFRLVPLGAEGWKLAGVFCATYIGGSINYMAAAQILDLRAGDLLTAGVAADNLVMTLYFLLLFALPRVGFLRRALPARPSTGEKAVGARASVGPIRPVELAVALGLALSLCAAGFGIAAALGYPIGGVLFVTALTVVLATLLPDRLAAVAGAEELGVLAMHVFFAVLGASANIAVVARAGPALFVFCAVVLLVHLLVILLACWPLRLDLAEVNVASNANIGGPTTAAAMATAGGWTALVIPAVLVGTLGYAIANFVGVAVATYLR
jgi:uncharacterized membrane protein